MKNSTDFTRDILKNTELQDISTCDNFIPYLVQKYISGVSPEYCVLMNSVLNDKLRTWTDVQEIYDFLKLIIPKKTNVNFTYFGSHSSKKEESKELEQLSNVLEISKRELKEMIVYFPELSEYLKEPKEKVLKVKK